MKTVVFFLCLSALVLLSCSHPAAASFKEAQQLKHQRTPAALEAALKAFDDSLYYALLSLQGKYEALKALGEYAATQGHYRPAAEQLEKARELKATDPQLYYLLGLSYANLARLALSAKEKQQHLDRAEKAYDAGLSLSQENYLLYYGKGILLGFLLEKPTEALRLMQQAYALAPLDVKVLFALGALQVKQGRPRAALRFYEEILTLTEKNSKQWNTAQQHLQQLKQRLQ